jgi:hypothetical protein
MAELLAMPGCSNTDDVVFDRIEFSLNPARMAELMRALAEDSDSNHPDNSNNNLNSSKE